MIFASDLDRTIIYSKRAIEELGASDASELIPVEKKSDNWVGYMTKASFFFLKELAKTHLFVPATTRTTEQYNRFVIFAEDISIKYAITANGANILYQGHPLTEWSEHIGKRLHLESVSQSELHFILQREGYHFDGQMKHAETVFFYYILNTLPSETEIKVINELATNFGWRISLQGRKLYFIPQAISKGSALEFICDRERMKPIAGAGDSILDWDFLQNCQYRFVPKHGELAGMDTTMEFTLTEKYGIAVGDEILQHFLALLSIKI